MSDFLVDLAPFMRDFLVDLAPFMRDFLYIAFLTANDKMRKCSFAINNYNEKTNI